MHEKELFRGLTTQEAKKRIEKFGLNEITEKKKVSAIKILLQQFNDFIIWVLIGATNLWEMLQMLLLYLLLL